VLLGYHVTTHVVLFCLDHWSIFRSLTVIVHDDFVFGVGVYTKRYGLIFKVINLIKMSQKGISHKDKISCASLKLVRVNCELASSSLSLMEIKLCGHFESLATNGKGNWLQFLGDIGARSHNLTEVIISNAIDSGDIMLPLILKTFEHLIWNTNI